MQTLQEKATQSGNDLCHKSRKVGHFIKECLRTNLNTRNMEEVYMTKASRMTGYQKKARGKIAAKTML